MKSKVASQIADNVVEVTAVVGIGVVAVQTGGDPVALGGMMAGVAGYRRAKSGEDRTVVEHKSSQ